MNGFSQAVVTIRRSPYQALSALLIVTITFFLGFLFSLLAVWGNELLRFAESQQELLAFFVEDVTEAEINEVAEALRANPDVRTLVVETQEQALEMYRAENTDTPLLTELVTADWLPASVAVSSYSVDSLIGLRATLEEFEVIEEVSFQEQVANVIGSWIRSIELVGAVIIGMLAISSFLTIVVLIALKATIQKYAINVLSLVGASRGYIRAPFMIEGMVYGVFGALIGWGLHFVALLYLTPGIQQFQGELSFVPVSDEFVLLQLGVGISIGLLLGGLAGLSAVNRLIKI